MKKYSYLFVVTIFLLVFMSVIPEAQAVTSGAVSVKGQDQRYKIGVVDLMILKRQRIGAFRLAREIGADGIELDMGGLGNRPTFENKLADANVREQFLDSSSALGIQISSLSMTGFYAQSFPTRDGVVNMVQDCINTMKKMDVKVAFLPLGVEGDLVKHPERRAAIVDRLKQIGKNADAAGIVIGIETSLDAEGEVNLLNEIGSPAIRICFNFSNALGAGRDLYKELEILGKDRICEIHCTNKDGVWLQNDPQIDMKQVKKTLDKMGWSGWLLVERSRDASKPHDVRGNFRANVTYLKSIFQ